MIELLWTVIAHLLSMLNKEYDWTALDNHRPFVIHLEQGIWLKFFGQASGTWRRVGSYFTYFLEEPAASIFARRQQICPKCQYFLPGCTALHLRRLCDIYV